jgi:hypothetical protein
MAAALSACGRSAWPVVYSCRRPSWRNRTYQKEPCRRSDHGGPCSRRPMRRDPSCRRGRDARCGTPRHGAPAPRARGRASCPSRGTRLRPSHQASVTSVRTRVQRERCWQRCSSTPLQGRRAPSRARPTPRLHPSAVLLSIRFTPRALAFAFAHAASARGNAVGVASLAGLHVRAARVVAAKRSTSAGLVPGRSSRCATARLTTSSRPRKRGGVEDHAAESAKVDAAGQLPPPRPFSSALRHFDAR